MASSSAGIKHVVLTGSPGVGKTTLVKKVCQVLRERNIPLQGFYTEDVRNQGSRIGFDVVTLDGKRGILARAQQRNEGGSQFCKQQSCFVGQYAVHVEDFEHLALPVLTQKNDTLPIYVIDEIGKMELFSEKFVRTVTEILGADNSTVFATIPIKAQRPIRFVEGLRNRKDVMVFEITHSNRNSVSGDIVAAIQNAYQSQKPTDDCS